MRFLALAAAFTMMGCAALNRPDPVDPKLEVGTAAREHRAAPARLRVVTFNVHGTTASAIEAALRTPSLAAADIVMLQEVHRVGAEPCSRACLAGRALGFDHAYAPGYGLGDGGSHGVAILSRLPLEDIEIIELPRYDVVVNSARRIALGATVRVAGRPVRIYSVHLDNRLNPAERRDQLTPVLDAAAAHPVALVAGDLNTSPFVWIGHMVPVPAGIQDDRLEAFARSRGFATPLTSSGPTSQWLSMRLDGAYARGMDVVAYDVDESVRISDHLPMWMDVVVAPPRERDAPAPSPSAAPVAAMTPR